ncbi:uncharacterized protein C19orf44 homolog, partial [Pithys albifrons albifrons]|uniref:uncharacterized protein C19orf44 homolog n=1 Tax=Pithys albifrons albifrons TaxID=3385563 RepID=UPI003A5CB917
RRRGRAGAGEPAGGGTGWPSRGGGTGRRRDRLTGRAGAGEPAGGGTGWPSRGGGTGRRRDRLTGRAGAGEPAGGGTGWPGRGGGTGRRRDRLAGPGRRDRQAEGPADRPGRGGGTGGRRDRQAEGSADRPGRGGGTGGRRDRQAEGPAVRARPGQAKEPAGRGGGSGCPGPGRRERLARRPRLVGVRYRGPPGAPRPQPSYSSTESLGLETTSEDIEANLPPILALSPSPEQRGPRPVVPWTPPRVGHGDGADRTPPAGLIPRSAVGVAGTELESAGRAASCRDRGREQRDGTARGIQRGPGSTGNAGNGHGAQRGPGSTGNAGKGHGTQRGPGSTGNAGNGHGAQRGPGSTGNAGKGHGAQPGPGSAAQTRTSSVLSKVAQLESKIMSRKKQLELQNTEPGLKALDEESSSSASRHGHGARGKKYLKNWGSGTRRDASSEGEESTQSPKKNVLVKQLDLDTDEEEMRELMENSSRVSCADGNRKVVVSDAQRHEKAPVPSGKSPLSHKEIVPTEVSKASSFHNKDSPESVFSRVNSPAPSPTSRNRSGQTVRSSMTDNPVKIAVPGTSYTKQSQGCLGSDRSEIKSLDELFSNADDTEDPTSRSSNDFRLNILSLDDLAPDSTSQAAELKQKGKDTEITQESNKYVMVEEGQASLKMTSAVTGHEVSEEDVEKSITEAKISEHLSGVSTDSPGHKQGYLDQDETTLSSEYSEDFEGSLSATEGESVSRTSEGHAESCSYSAGHSSSAPSPLQPQERHKRGHRVPVRDTGVQTAGPPFSYCWAKANPSAVLSPPLGTSYIEPVPIASHVISMDAVEALTTYSPSALVLQAMFKQHLLLTQQFVENVQHLHSSLVDSLEREKFHYHTLEEAKEYIKNHKSPPLTLEQALEEIRRAQEE